MARAGRWFLRSGIQERGGGVARYYRADLERNHAVSTEITGYALSTLLFLHACTEDRAYLQSADEAARFLTGTAWNASALPFELESSENAFTYFFDCGIVLRGILAAWRANRNPEFLQVAVALGDTMAADFPAKDGAFHPILTLPGKQALEYEPLRWSRAPGCYQLKSAMGWCDLFEATGDARFEALYESALENCLRNYGEFLPGHPDHNKVVDRLHAFLYFLEGLLPRVAEKRCAAALCHGIQLVSRHIAETAGVFERSDVYAQLLRVRLFADWAGVVPLDAEAARREAGILAEFQVASADPRTDGGFFFGRQREQWLPYVNPVSTAFALQALALWNRHQSCGDPVAPRELI